LKFLFFALFFATTFIFSCADYPRIDEIENTFKPGTDFTDTRNIPQTYKTVIIGDQTWMARNLNYDVDGSKCYDDKPGNCSNYGRLYDWATAMDLDESYNKNSSGYDPKHQGICPNGWHLPSDVEWQALVEYVGTNVGVKLRAKSGWSDKDDNGDDDYGFSAMPSGFYDNKKFGNMEEGNQIGYWWSNTELKNDPEQAWYRRIGFDYYNVSKVNGEKTYMFAVRCIKD